MGCIAGNRKARPLDCLPCGKAGACRVPWLFLCDKGVAFWGNRNGCLGMGRCIWILAGRDFFGILCIGGRGFSLLWARSQDAEKFLCCEVFWLFHLEFLRYF